jgi:hypothetical protein
VRGNRSVVGGSGSHSGGATKFYQRRLSAETPKKPST